MSQAQATLTHHPRPHPGLLPDSYRVTGVNHKHRVTPNH